MRRGIGEVAKRASDSETLEKLKTQATEILQDLPDAASKGFSAVLRTAEASKRTVAEWARGSVDQATPGFNATGILVQPFGLGVPVSERVIAAGAELIRGNCIYDDETAIRLRQAASQHAPHDCAIAITGSFPAALTAFSQLVQERPLLVHRSQAVRLPGGVPLPEAFGTLLPVIQEVGSVSGLHADDFEGMDQFCLISADPGNQPPELLKPDHDGALRAVVLPIATVHRVDDLIPSAQETLEAGADFVLMPGNGLAGGPECGLIIGKPDALALITESPVWQSLQSNDAVSAMMTQALDPAQLEDLPIVALLSTSVQNLEARAQRMSVRISGCDEIESCKVTNESAKLTENGRWEMPSCQVRVAHQSLSPSSWAAKLRAQNPALVVEHDDDEIIIDLRWIGAADDNQISAAVTAQVESDASSS